MYTYLLKIDDDATLIQGDHEINLELDTKSALLQMENDEIENDWFLAFTNKICQITNFKRIVPNGELNVENHYWAEYAKRIV